MPSSATTLQVLRVPVAVALLTGWAACERSRTVELVGSTGPAAGPELWAHTAGRVAVLAALLVVLLVGRRRRHPWPVLLLELVVALPLAVVPALQWVLWMGITPVSELLVVPGIQVLGVVWVVVAAIELVRRGR